MGSSSSLPTNDAFEYAIQSRTEYPMREVKRERQSGIGWPDGPVLGANREIAASLHIVARSWLRSKDKPWLSHEFQRRDRTYELSRSAARQAARGAAVNLYQLPSVLARPIPHMTGPDIQIISR
jgi:hypothetical protein